MYGNRAHETSATTGTGTYVLDGAADAESRTLVAARKDASGDATGPWTAKYVAVQGSQYEIGRGSLSEGTGPGGTDELTRANVEESTNGNSPVSWGGGSRDVFLAPSAQDLETLLDELASDGILCQTAAKTYARRTIQGGTHVAVDDGDGVAGDPTIDDSALDTTFAKLAFDGSKAFTAEPILANTIALQGKESGGTKRDLVVIDGSNVMLIGEGANVQKLQPSSLANLLARVGGVDYRILTRADLPAGYLSGLGMTRSATDRVQIAVGECRDAADTVAMRLAATLAKQIDATWTAGDGNGGFPSGLTSGSPVADTWYHVFVIEDGAGTVDAGYDSSLTASNLLSDSGYTKYRRIGSVWTSAGDGAVIRLFVQDGNSFIWDSPIESYSAAIPGTSRVSMTMACPPDVRSWVTFSHYVSATAGEQILFTHGDGADVAPSSSAAPGVNGGTPNGSAHHLNPVRLLANTSRQIHYRATAAGNQLDVWTSAYEDRRGQF